VEGRVRSEPVAQLNPVVPLQGSDIARREPDRYLDGERHGIVREHEALQGLVTSVIVPYRRDHKLRQARGEILLPSGAEARPVKEGGSALGRANAALEEIMRTVLGYGLEEIGEAGKAFVLVASTEEGELGLVVGILVDLAVIELGGADNLRWPEELSSLLAEPGVGCEIPMLRDPGRER